MKLKKIPNCVLFTLLGFSLCFFSACQKKHKQNAVVSLQSPNAEIEIKLGLSNDNQPWYAVLHKSTSVIDTSIIGFSFANAPTFFDNLTITKTTFSQQHTSWKPIWGQQKEIENKYNQTTVTLKDTLDRELDLVFRAYDDGVAFRYVFSECENWSQKLTITDEKTTLNLLEDYESWWIPANYDSYEHKTVRSNISDIQITETAAKHNIMLIVHEPVKPTGLCRTWPNLMTQEGVRGQEFDVWSEGNPTNHLMIIPFTRGLAGPIDYTLGVFDVHFDAYRKENSVKTTLCKQLAAYVLLNSPIQMAADLPDNYKKYDDAFTFIKSVPTDWSETRFLSGSIGEYIAMARKDKKSEEWFVGVLTNEDSRTIELPLHFLNDTKTYTAIVFADAKNTNYKTNPNDYKIAEYKVSSNTTLKPFLASSGGVAIHIKPII